MDDEILIRLKSMLYSKVTNMFIFRAYSGKTLENRNILLFCPLEY